MTNDVNEEKGPAAVNLEKGGLEYTKYDQADLRDKVLNAEARQATATEHELTFTQAIKTYKRAAFWSIRMSHKMPARLLTRQPSRLTSSFP